MKSNILSRIRFGSEIFHLQNESFQVQTTKIFVYIKKTRTLSLVAKFLEIDFKELELTKKSVRDQSFGSRTQIQMGLLEFIFDFFDNFGFNIFGNFFNQCK